MDYNFTDAVPNLPYNPWPYYNSLVAYVCAGNDTQSGNAFLKHGESAYGNTDQLTQEYGVQTASDVLTLTQFDPVKNYIEYATAPYMMMVADILYFTADPGTPTDYDDSRWSQISTQWTSTGDSFSVDVNQLPASVLFPVYRRFRIWFRSGNRHIIFIAGTDVNNIPYMQDFSSPGITTSPFTISPGQMMKCTSALNNQYLWIRLRSEIIQKKCIFDGQKWTLQLNDQVYYQHNSIMRNTPFKSLDQTQGWEATQARPDSVPLLYVAPVYSDLTAWESRKRGLTT